MRRTSGSYSCISGFTLRWTLCLSFLLSVSSIRSSGSSFQLEDSLTLASKKRANKAALLSAVLPGAGQVYNHKYWKLPILYAGAGVLIYSIQFNDAYYDDFRDAYIDRADGDPNTVDDYPNLTLDDLRVRKDYYRRNRDLCYILCGGLYILNIVDAYVDAQLKGFDVSDQLTMKVGPAVNGLPSGDIATGIRLSFHLSRP